MPSTPDTIREVLQAALLPKLTAIEKDLQSLRAEVTQSNQELRAEMKQSSQDLRAELELKFSILLNEIQKLGIRLESNADKLKAETETYVHRNITPLAERVAVLEMSFRNLKERLEQAS